jgi:hypothetical protein
MKEKRKPRAYKITDTEYSRAMKRAKKEKVHLATMIEEVVYAYGDGAHNVTFKSKTT